MRGVLLHLVLQREDLFATSRSLRGRAKSFARVKAVRNEALKPYVWRLQRDLSDVHGQLESFEAQHRSRGLKESSPLRWHSTELKFLAETLELEIGSIEEEIGRNRMLQQEKK